MRFHFLGLMLIFSLAAAAAAAQQPRPRQETTEQRINRLEQQLRAVQRRVFPNGTQPTVEPEIPPEVQAAMGGAPQRSAITSLSDRLDAIEGQMRSLTGQIEEQGNRNRQIEEQVARLRADLAAQQAAAAERAAPVVAPPPRAVSTPARAPAAGAAETPGDAEEAYNVGYRLWEQRRYAEAQAALERAATRFPDSRWTSWMRNMQGRAYLDENKPATAARILLANYQNNPRGERAADSLFYLGQALARLNRRPEACRVYDELAQVYPEMRDFLRERLPQARRDARCTTN
jgi:TolA-binding protein